MSKTDSLFVYVGTYANKDLALFDAFLRDLPPGADHRLPASP